MPMKGSSRRHPRKKRLTGSESVPSVTRISRISNHRPRRAKLCVQIVDAGKPVGDIKWSNKIRGFASVNRDPCFGRIKWSHDLPQFFPTGWCGTSLTMKWASGSQPSRFPWDNGVVMTTPNAVKKGKGTRCILPLLFQNATNVPFFRIERGEAVCRVHMIWKCGTQPIRYGQPILLNWVKMTDGWITCKAVMQWTHIA